MRKLFRFLFFCTVVVTAWFATSCQDKNIWDPIPGLEKNPAPPKPEVSEKFIRVEDPRIAKDVNYWIFSANDTVTNLDLEKGLMVRKSIDLTDVSVEGYVLSSVVEDWAKAKLLQLDAAIDTNLIRMRLPSVKWDGTQWRLYYTVTANTQASVIGYATSLSLENQEWTDHGLVLASAPGDPVKAAGPSFIISADGSEHYLAYGAGYGGIYLVELDITTGMPLSGFGSCIVRYSSDGTNQRVGFPEIIYNSSTHFYYCLATNEDGRVYGQNIEITRSAEITGPYLGYNGDNFTVGKADVDLWNMWHALVPYAMLDSAKAVTAGWGNVGSPGVIKDGNNWFIVHNAKTLKVHKPCSFEGYSTLHIRQLDWLPINSGWPVICPERYAGVQNDTLTSDDIIGEWDYNTLWYETYIQGINGEFWSGMMLNANNTISGTITGNWTFEPSTRLLTIISATWGNERINLCVRRVKDWEYKITGTLPLTLAAAGVNNTFAQKPGVWMKKRPVVN